jgi:hypothetical protein
MGRGGFACRISTLKLRRGDVAGIMPAEQKADCRSKAKQVEPETQTGASLESTPVTGIYLGSGGGNSSRLVVR